MLAFNQMQTIKKTGQPTGALIFDTLIDLIARNELSVASILTINAFTYHDRDTSILTKAFSDSI